MRPLLSALLLLGALVAPGRAQGGAPGLARVHHTFPEAGRTLHVVAEGLAPPTTLWLHEPAEAPPSVLRFLELLAAEHPLLTGSDGALGVTLWPDEQGRLSLAIPLEDPGDAGRALALSLEDGTERVDLRLVVQPPLLLLAAPEGLLRIDLRDGALLPSSLPGEGGLRGAAFSRDGLLAWILREGGRLQALSALQWQLRQQIDLPAAGDDLAHGPASGPAFVVVRPEGVPFAPPGRLVLVGDGWPELVVEPLARPVEGRRWAISDDGRLAFVAEDDLLVREVDLLERRARGVLSAGFPGDSELSDMTWADGRLLVLSRRPEGRTGGLTVLDTRTGRLSLFTLGIDPRRLVRLGDDSLLVVPASGSTVVVLQDGVPVRSDDLSPWGVTGVRDAAAVPGGGLLLVETGEGTLRLARWEPATALQLLPPLDVPDARRTISAGHDAVLLLGASDGRLHRVSDPLRGDHEPLGELRVDPEAPFVVLP